MDDIDIFEPDALDRSVEAYENLPLPAQIAAGFTPAGLAADVATAAKYGRDAVRQLVAGKYGEAAAPAILAALAGVGLIPVVGDIAKKYGSRAVKDSFQPKGRVLGDVYDQELGGYTGQELIEKYNLNPNLSEADAYADLARRYQADKGQNPNLTHMMPRPKGSDDSVKSRIAAGQTSSGLDTRIHQEGDEYFTVDGSNIFKGNMKHKYFEYQLDPDTIPPNTKVERLQTVDGKPQKVGEFVHKPSLQGMADGGVVENIDIFDDPNRDPVYEDMGFSFDNERGQYFEVVSHPEYGVMRRYVSPRDQSPVPELSDARNDADMLRRAIASISGRVSDEELKKMKAASGSKGLVKGRGYKEGGGVDIFGYNLGGSVSEMMNPVERELPSLSPAQIANMGAAFADPLGMVDITGEYPEFPAAGVSVSEMVMEGPRSPSLIENLSEGSYGAAALQGIGVIPVVGGAARAARNLIKGADRLEKAKKAGFDTETVYYHATDRFEGDPTISERFEKSYKDFSQLKPSEKGKLGPGIYMSADPAYTEKYIRRTYQSGTKDPVFGEGARILPIFVRGKIATRDVFDEAVEKAGGLLKKEFEEIDAAAKNNEFDELMANRQRFAMQKQKAQEIMAEDGFSGFKVGDEIVVFDPKNIRSVNAEFEDLDSPELLKADGGEIRKFKKGGDVDLDDIDIFESPMARFREPVRRDLGPMQMAIPEEEGLRDRAERLLAGLMGDDREDYRRAEKALMAADVLPVLGDVGAAADLSDAIEKGDLSGAGIAALGLIPVVGGVASRTLKGSRGAFGPPSLEKQRGSLGIVSLDSPIEDQLSLPLGEQKRLKVGYYHPVSGGLKLKTLPKDMDYELSPSGVLVPSKTIKPEDMEGGRVIFDAGDRAVAGQKLVRINGVDLEFPIDLMGGPQFMMYQKHLRDNGGIGSIWASDQGAITSLTRQAVGDEDVYFMPTAMTQTGLDFNTMMSDALIQQADKMKITKKSKKAFDKAVKNIRPEWKGIDSPEARDQLLENGPLRHAFVDRMDQAEFQSMGFPDVAQTRVAITDPAYLDLPFASGGMTVGKVDKGNPILNKKGEVIGFEPVENPNLPHPTYSTQLSGDYVGGFEVPVPRQLLAPDFYKKRREMGAGTGGDARSFQLTKPTQQATPEWVDTISEYIEQVKANQ